MKKITYYICFCAIFVFQWNYAQNTNDSFKPRRKELELYQYRGDSITILKAPLATTAITSFDSKLPYPIIFIHGLDSNSETWTTTTNYLDNQFQFTYGGRFDFCLNDDGNNTTANKNFYPTAGADIAAFETSVQNGDYYTINFDVGTDGSYSPSSSSSVFALSNQAAIAKQAMAVRKTIERVMQITGRDKVVLVTHSMGGLAAREYIQNSFDWQTDGNHHVAKLAMAGTPHGGSNTSGFGLGFLIGMDESSEAIRDLRTSYYYSGEPGRYLFGGVEIENNTNMNDNSYTPDFYNVDMNCNGIINENIIGLNQRPIDNLIDYSSVIGEKNGGTTDGVVDATSSNLNLFYPTLTYPNKLFYYSAIAVTEVHTDLPSQYYQLIQAMDEPNFKELGYKIITNKPYIGFTTIQENPSVADDDFYKFDITNNVIATVAVSSIVTNQMIASLLDSNGNLIGTTHNNIAATLNFTQNLTPGSYYLKLSSMNPTSNNYKTPYQFIINTTLSNADYALNSMSFYPNPTTDKIYFENQNFNKATVYSFVGQKLEEIALNSTDSLQNISIANYTKGIYFISLEKENQLPIQIKVIKE